MRGRKKAREERRRESVVQEAFDNYLDHAVDRVATLGVEEEVAMEAIFNAVEHLGVEGVLPLFPEGGTSYQAMGAWLVAAADFGFVDFMVEAAQE